MASLHSKSKKEEQAKPNMIDFCDPNKDYPNDNFPRPHIELLVDATTVYTALTFTMNTRDTIISKFTWKTRKQPPFARQKESFWVYCYSFRPQNMEEKKRSSGTPPRDVRQTQGTFN